MRTLARAAMETDKALEDEETYWLKGETPGINGNAGTGTLMRVHASPSLNKKVAEEERGVDTSDSIGQSPRKFAAAKVSEPKSPQLNCTVQETDDRIPKESLYGTLRHKSTLSRSIMKKLAPGNDKRPFL